MGKLTVIAGPPCAGKNLYLQENAAPGDLRFDYDVIHAAVTGLPSRQHTSVGQQCSIGIRGVVARSVVETDGVVGWIIHGAPRRADRDSWVDEYDAEIVMVNPGIEECHKRADADSRPSEWHGYIDNWFESYGADDGAHQGLAMRRRRLALLELEL